MKPSAAPSHHPVPPFDARTGVLLVSLGTPDAPTAAALRPYLRQFLADPRVVELPRWLWKPLLYGVIVPLRAPKSAAAYAKIWDATHNQSPLRVITEAQAHKLQQALDAGDPAVSIVVRHAMRYGQPSISPMLDELADTGCTRIIIVPLYPQYSGATVGTVGDEVAVWMARQRWQPAINIVPPYYDHPAYIQALAASARAHLKAHKPQVLVASFHGMPLAACEKGDPYYCHCHKTARLLAEALGMPFCETVEEVVAHHRKRGRGKKGFPLDSGLRRNDAAGESGLPPVLLTFQSRFGKAEWLQPYTAEVLEALPATGIKKVAAICPGFAADCVETLEEIALEGAKDFKAAGGTAFSLIPCLNDGKAGMEMLKTLVRNQLK